MEFNLLPETFVRLFDPVYLILEINLDIFRQIVSNSSMFQDPRLKFSCYECSLFLLLFELRNRNVIRAPYPCRSIGRNRFRLTFLPFNSRVREEN